MTAIARIEETRTAAYRRSWLWSLVPLVLAFSPLLSAAERPADWLKTEGKGEGWQKGTAKIRELLAELDAGDAKVKKWLPAVKHRCEVTQQLSTFGAWEQAIYGELFEAMLEDLANGDPLLRRFAGKTVPYGYWSGHLRKLTGTRIQVPPDYDADREYQLFMYYKLGGGLYWRSPKKKYARPWDEGAVVTPPYRPTAEMCQKTPETFHAWTALYHGLKGRMGVDVELMEMTEALTRDFPISADRVFLSGFSDGGFTSLWLASRYPHLVAGIAPEVANWQYTNVNQIGLYNVATLVVDGWYDGGFVAGNVTRFHTLSNMGYDFNIIMGHHGHATKPYEDEATFKRIMEWARTKRRNPNPTRIRYATWNLNWHRAFWFSIERMVEPALAAQVDAGIKDGNRIEVESKNIAAYRLSLNDKLVDTRKPLTVVTNGTESYSGPFKPELDVEVVKLKEAKFTKSPASPGGITARMTMHTYDKKMFLKVPGHSWHWIGPTGGSEAERAALSKYFPKWGAADKDIEEKLLKGRNLFIYGGPGLNKVADRIADDLPIKFEKGRFTIGNNIYDKPEHCVRFIHPSPFNPKKYIIMFAFNDAAAAAKDNFAGKGSDFFKTSSWGFREGDCQVFGVKDPVNEFGVNIASRLPADYYIFDSSWQAPDQTVLGTAEEDFCYIALMRLKADAMKEATRADACVVSGIWPGFNQWRCNLRKGPVTLNDIAVTHQLPIYGMLCKVTGKQLKGVHSRALASTILEHKSDPSYDPRTSLLLSEIDDGKTYTLAADYHVCDGMLAYHVEPKKMPQPYFFARSPAEFDAHEHAGFRCSDLVQTDIEFTEAVAQYIRKRGKVAPRPVIGKPNYYLMDMRTNHLGEYDWVHLSLPVSFRDPATGRPIRRRDTINIGLAVSGEAGSAAPRSNSKHFASLGPAAPFKFSMSALDGRLPVAVSAEAEAFALSGACDDPSGKDPVKMVPAGEGKSGKVLLIRLRLTNRGDRDLSGVVILGSPRIRRFHGGYWPERPEKGRPKPYYRGFVDEVGPYRKKYQTNATLVLYRNGLPAAGRLIVPNAGYNRGTIGMEQQVSIKAGETLELPVLLIAANASNPKKPKKIDLAQVLESIKGSIMEGTQE